MAHGDHTNPLTQDDSPICFRPTRGHLYLCIVLTLMSLVFGAGILALAHWDHKNSTPLIDLVVLILAIIWLSGSLVGLLAIFAHYRKRLLLSAESITQRGCFASRTINLQDVIKIAWRGRPKCATILVASPYSIIRIYLGEYSDEDEVQLIQFFHDIFDRNLQDGWSRFLAADEQHHTTSKPMTIGGAIFLSAASLVMAGLQFYAWKLSSDTKFLVFSIFFLFSPIMILWRFRPWTKQSNDESSD